MIKVQYDIPLKGIKSSLMHKLYPLDKIHKNKCLKGCFPILDKSSIVDVWNEKKAKVDIKNSGHGVGVMFSGGYDSTSLIIDHLEKGDTVYPYFVGFITGKNSEVKENHLLADLTIKSLQSVYGSDRCKFLIRLCDISAWDGLGGFLRQQPIATLFAAMLPDKDNQYYNEAIESIEMGYRMNDNAISFLNELNNLYKSACKITKQKNIPLKFPLKQCSKEDTFNRCEEIKSKYKIGFPVHSCDEFSIFCFRDEFNNHIKFLVLFDNNCNKDKAEPYSNMLITVDEQEYNYKKQ